MHVQLGGGLKADPGHAKEIKQKVQTVFALLVGVRQRMTKGASQLWCQSSAKFHQGMLCSTAPNWFSALQHWRQALMGCVTRASSHNCNTDTAEINKNS